MNRPVPALGAGAVSTLRVAPRPWLAPLLILLLALVLRAAAARGDLWLDEIWSWLAVRDRVHGLADVFLGIRHDNNHILNSLWIHALGLEVDGRWYRLPAVVAGSLSVLVAWQLMAPAGRVAQWLVALLMAPSFLLVNYASEARGYGVLMLCVLVSLWALECFDAACARGDAGRARAALATFWLAAMLGMMAHASYGATLLSLALWFALRLWRAPLAQATRWRRFVLPFGVPMLFAAWLSAVTYLDATAGGGPLMNAWQAAAAACSLALGGPVDGMWVWPLAGLAMAALFTEAALARRAGDERALLWLVMLLVPAVPLAAGLHQQFIYPRFFLGEVLYLLLAVAQLGARAWRHGGAPRLVCCGVLAAISLGNLFGLALLVRDGRGQPGAAVRYMSAHSHAPRIVVASDHAFRHGITLDYYTRLLAPGQSFQLLVAAPWPAQGPEWILRQDVSRTWQAAPALHDAEGRDYRLEAFYPHAGLSGFSLALYHRREARAP